MTPVRSIKNQYLGINAHLQSLLQQEGGWDSFHALHIGHIATVMQGQLRGMGYEARIEESLQIRRVGEPDRFPISDVSIFDTDSQRAARPQSQESSVQPGVAAISAPVLLDMTDEDISYYHAIGIYEAEARRTGDGVPVAWVELLSPSNKPMGRDFERYLNKRNQILQSGIVFVEIDYLNEQPPTFKSLRSYAPRRRGDRPQPGSAPYLIVVVDPRPELPEGEGRIYSLGIDEPFRLVDIPLNAGDVLAFDFGQPYNRSFEEMYYGDRVDYSQLLVNFDLYREDDQARIVTRMLTVLEAAQAGRDLEQPPQPVEMRPLDQALQQLSVLTK